MVEPTKPELSATDKTAVDAYLDSRIGHFWSAVKTIGAAFVAVIGFFGLGNWWDLTAGRQEAAATRVELAQKMKHLEDTIQAVEQKKAVFDTAVAAAEIKLKRLTDLTDDQLQPFIEALAEQLVKDDELKKKVEEQIAKSTPEAKKAADWVSKHGAFVESLGSAIEVGGKREKAIIVKGNLHVQKAASVAGKLFGGDSIYSRFQFKPNTDFEAMDLK
jgi:hypothetical protein